MSFKISNKLQIILKSLHFVYPDISRPLSVFVIHLNKDDQHWRKLRENPNSFGPLTNLPDYTYMDGRVTPLGSNLKRRLDKQKEIAKKIVVLNEELDFAKSRYVKMQRQKEEFLEQERAKQLKPKGILLYENI